MCRSRRELSNAYLLVKFGFDAAENEPSKVSRIAELSPPARQRAAQPAGLASADAAGLAEAGSVRARVAEPTSKTWSPPPPYPALTQNKVSLPYILPIVCHIADEFNI